MPSTMVGLPNYWAFFSLLVRASWRGMDAIDNGGFAFILKPFLWLRTNVKELHEGH